MVRSIYLPDTTDLVVYSDNSVVRRLLDVVVDILANEYVQVMREENKNEGGDIRQVLVGEPEREEY